MERHWRSARSYATSSTRTIQCQVDTVTDDLSSRLVATITLDTCSSWTTSLVAPHASRRGSSQRRAGSRCLRFRQIRMDTTSTHDRRSRCLVTFCRDAAGCHSTESSIDSGGTILTKLRGGHRCGYGGHFAGLMEVMTTTTDLAYDAGRSCSYSSP